MKWCRGGVWGGLPPSGISVTRALPLGGVWGASPPQESPLITRALPPQRPCLAPNFFRPKKFSTEKFFGRKNFRPKTFSDEKNWGQGTGARHGRCGGKARVINGDSWGAKPPRTPPGGKARVTEIPGGGKAPPDPPTTPFQKICPSGASFLK